MDNELNYLSEKMFEIESQIEVLECYGTNPNCEDFKKLEDEYELLQNIVNFITVNSVN